jgi:hypothetical protein
LTGTFKQRWGTKVSGTFANGPQTHMRAMGRAALR